MDFTLKHAELPDNILIEIIDRLKMILKDHFDIVEIKELIDSKDIKIYVRKLDVGEWSSNYSIDNLKLKYGENLLEDYFKEIINEIESAIKSI